MRRVVIESPCSPRNGRTMEQNLDYAIACARDVLRQGDSPYASHLFFTRFLDDFDHAEREIGITAGFAWGKVADLCAVYRDFGITGGMRRGVEIAEQSGVSVEYRVLYPDQPYRFLYGDSK